MKNLLEKVKKYKQKNKIKIKQKKKDTFKPGKVHNLQRRSLRNRK